MGVFSRFGMRGVVRELPDMKNTSWGRVFRVQHEGEVKKQLNIENTPMWACFRCSA